MDCCSMSKGLGVICGLPVLDPIPDSILGFSSVLIFSPSSCPTKLGYSKYLQYFWCTRAGGTGNGRQSPVEIAVLTKISWLLRH